MFARYFIRCIHQLVPRPPVVTIMGHVDHGKTTLLDYLRNSRIVEQEFGGITQHIGAFVVPFKQKQQVTIIDTPGHAAFAGMRQRGANVTDIVVLVIACEDGVLDQTIESIEHTKRSNVPLIVAINKIDIFPKAKDLENQVNIIRRQLMVHDVITEQDGGEVQLVKISALKGVGIESLKESIIALADTLELKADIECPMKGCVIESKLDSHRGQLCTILVQQGRLTKGSYLVAGGYNWARVRALFDERGQLRPSCDPGFPVLVTGWREERLPAPGEFIYQVKNESEAKHITRSFLEEQAKIKASKDAEAAAQKAEQHYEVYKEKLAEKIKSGYLYRPIFYNQKGVRSKETEEDKYHDKKINLVLKCDVDGTLEALLGILDTYDPHNNQLIKLDIMHYGVGDIVQNDLIMASSFKNSLIYGFNVKPADQKLLIQAKQEGVTLRTFKVIYSLIDDLKARITEMMPDVEQHEELGRASVIEEFVITEKGKKKIHVAGCRCTKGAINRSLNYKLLRNNETLVTGLKVNTLKHVKDDVKEIAKGRECGISFEENEDLEFKPGDILVGYEIKKFKPKLKWDLKGFS